MATRYSGSENINEQVCVRRDDGSYGGWKTDVLAEGITGKIEEKFLLCNYCRGVLRDACLFEKDGKQELACSVCIPAHVNKQIAQINSETVKEKQAICPMRTEGCDWTNELSELLHHLEECELFPVACPLGCTDEKGEVSRVERRGVETHRICCPMRTVKCEYCSNSVKACDMNGHLEVCEKFPTKCPNKCDEEALWARTELYTHLNEECLLHETECPYSQYGCEAKVQRRHMLHHEKEDIHTHLYLSMLNNVKTQDIVAKLEKENVKLKQKELEFQSVLIPIISSLKMKETLEWKMTGVKDKISQKEETYSEQFYVGFYKFQAAFHWYRAESYTGIFLHLINGEWDDALKWPPRFKARIVLINSNTASKDNYVANFEVTKTDLHDFPNCFKKPGAVKNAGFGKSKFTTHANLLLDKFYRNDSITVNITVKLLKDH